MSARVWVLGDAVVDLLPESQGRLLQCPGGAPANVAVGIARLGGKSAFIGKVGDDPFGRFMYQTLSTENVDTRYMSLDPQQRTSIVAVGLDEQGERNFTFMVRPSADLFLQPGDLPAFGPGEWLHLCSIALSAEPSRSTAFLAMEKIRQAGGNISFDPNIRSDLWQSEALLRKYLDRALSLANIAKLSEEELLFISGESQVQQGAYSLVQRYSLTLLLITQGKNGVLVYFQGSLSTIPPNLFLSSIRPGQEMLLSLDYLQVWLILEYQQIPDSLNESLHKLRFVVLWRPRLKAR